MSRTGVANLPLHGGKAPKWLFNRMVLLSKSITDVIIFEYGREEFLRRISDPFWFQALSCVLGFDWHSSGCTTVTCGALKEAIKPNEHGFAICGGKGKASRKTPEEIENIGDTYNLSTNKIEGLKYSSRMAAKVDNTAVQDGHDLYHHVFLFTERGKWGVIQQGMCSDTNYARRYHWLSGFNSFIADPHNAIIGENTDNDVLNMASKNSRDSQKTCVDLVCDHPRHLANDWASLTRLGGQTTLDEWNGNQKQDVIVECLDMPRSINWNKMREIYDFQPKNYEEFLSLKGVGPNTVRAIALISELIYGDKPSWKDPIKFTFAHGGKDGVPYEVDRTTYSNSVKFLEDVLIQAKINEKDKLNSLKRLHNISQIQIINTQNNS